MNRSSHHRTSLILASLALLAGPLAGCGVRDVDTTYGHTRGNSVNGTGALAELFRRQGHSVRTARRLNEHVGEWADTIVRFSPDPGPIDAEEADWYLDWQFAAPDRHLIYVCRNADGAAEFWARVLALLPADAPQEVRDRVEQKAANAESRAAVVPPPTDDPADPIEWFGVEDSAAGPTVCKTLDGPWSEGIDPRSVALPIDDALVPGEQETVLLAGNGRPIVIDWTWDRRFGFEPSGVMVLAHGAFLLNQGLVDHARRPLAMRVVDWVGPGPRRVAFIEGSFVLEDMAEMPNLWDRIRRLPMLTVVEVHVLVLALAAALARAVILGRPRAAPAAGADRPRAHAEALGDLMARTGERSRARDLIAAYRSWRRPEPRDDPAATARP